MGGRSAMQCVARFLQLPTEEALAADATPGPTSHGLVRKLGVSGTGRVACAGTAGSALHCFLVRQLWGCCSLWEHRLQHGMLSQHACLHPATMPQVAIPPPGQPGGLAVAAEVLQASLQGGIEPTTAGRVSCVRTCKRGHARSCGKAAILCSSCCRTCCHLARRPTQWLHRCAGG